MKNDWFEIPDPRVDAAEIVERVCDRLTAAGGFPPSQGTEEDPKALADDLRKQMISNHLDNDLPVREHDCDIVPRNYVIEWRVPILGPIHALIRRIINTEIRRYLSYSLDKQSYLNRQMLRLLDELAEQNKHLSREIDELREGKP